MNVETMTPAERLARWDSPDRPDGWNHGDEHHLADLVIRDLRAAHTPPAGGVREAVAKAVFAADEPTLDYERKYPSETDEVHSGREAWRYYLGIADRLILTGIPAFAEGEELFIERRSTGFAHFGGLGGDVAKVTLTNEAWRGMGSPDAVRVSVAPSAAREVSS